MPAWPNAGPKRAKITTCCWCGSRLERLLYRLSLFQSSGAIRLERRDALCALGTGIAPRHARFGSAGFRTIHHRSGWRTFSGSCAIVEVEADGVDFDPRSVRCEDIRAQDEYAGIRVKLRATVGKAVVPLQVDVGFGDALPVAPEEITFPVMLGMAAPKLRAYSRETVVAEKLEAIVKLGMLNSRFKDYFDLHYLAQKFPFDGALLVKSIAGTFARRGTAFPEGLPAGLTPMFGTDPAKIRGWQAFWRKTGPKAAAPTLEAVIQLLIEFLEPPLDAAAKGKPFQATWKSKRWQK